ncbi:MAG: hypothetical protein EPO16_04900 [Dehalococcoidia bacterium]|nr:MAG: hypothetical protein EPO16_04900 [Dehalococcoidia bacterium]
MAMFIRVDIDSAVQQDAALCKRIAEVCPVDIFKVVDSRLETVEANLDECTLCDLCIHAAPGKVQVVKLYR